MHSRKKGKSRSKKPPTKTAPAWVEYKTNEIVELIINLANSGHTPSEMGTILRDQYGIPDVKAITGKTIQDILKENNLLGDIPEDLMNLIKKSVKLKEHMGKNRKDFSAKRGYQLTVSKIRRLVKYYVREGRVSKDWHFSDEMAALLVK